LNSHSSGTKNVRPVYASLLDPEGLAAALDCDVLISCVDRPWPRYVLNAVAYAHLIPVIDGGILARVDDCGLPFTSTRGFTRSGRASGASTAWLLFFEATSRSIWMASLTDPDYLKGLSEDECQRFGRRNVFAFSLSVAAHEPLQLVGLVAGMDRIGGRGPQRYHCYPGEMMVEEPGSASQTATSSPLTVTAADLTANLRRTTTLPAEDHEER
jgi:hypothetical protein